MTVGIDLTDGTIRAVTVNADGTVVARCEQSIADGGMVAAVRAALRESRSSAHDEGAAAGFAVQWPGDSLPAEIAAVVIEDAAPPPVVIAAGPATALAEVWCGAARGLRHVITLAVGEHVTAGVLVGGEVLRGAHGYAASVGWLALNPVEREDYRRYGGLEAEVAAAGIVRRLVWRIKSGDHSNVVDAVDGDFARLTADHVFDAARAGDGVCISVVRDTAKYVGMAISNLATTLDPEAIVLGGTLAGSGDMMLEPIRTECSRRLRPSQAERIQIVLSTLGADAAAIGAARAALLQRQ